MKAGRRPKPTRLKILQGNPGKRPLNRAEPKPQLGAPNCPDWLKTFARDEWARIVPALDKIGLLTAVDGFILEAYCYNYGEWRRHIEIVKQLSNPEHGSICRPSTENREYIQVLPQVGIAQKHLQMARTLASELGLSPSMRSRMNVRGEEQPKEVDKLEAFYGKQKKNA